MSATKLTGKIRPRRSTVMTYLKCEPYGELSRSRITTWITNSIGPQNIVEYLLSSGFVQISYHDANYMVTEDERSESSH